MKNVIYLALTLNMTAALGTPLNVNVISLTNADSQDQARIGKALELIKKVVNSTQFKDALLAMKFQVGRYVYKGYSQTSLTPSKILTTITEAKENFRGGTIGVMDLNLDMYYEVSDIIGYTSREDRFIHMNRFIQSEYSPAKTAGNIFHEWLHKINHEHSYEYNEYRPHSVPYKLGSLLTQMAAEIESGGDPILKELMMDEFKTDYGCSRSAPTFR